MLWVIYRLKGGVNLQVTYSLLWVIYRLKGGVNLHVTYRWLWVICSLKSGVSLQEALQCSLDSPNPIIGASVSPEPLRRSRGLF